jgi:hypothetical protein
MRILALILFTAVVTNVRGIDLKDAFYAEGLEISIKGLSGHDVGYADKDIWIGVLNTKGHPVTITAEPGFILASEEGDVQDMIIVEPFEMIASSEYFTEAGVKAMCIQAGNKSPSVDNTFVPHKYAEGSLGLLAGYVHENNYVNHMGQEAMWVVSDKHSLYDITGYAVEANPLRQFVADLTGSSFDTSLVDKQVDYIDRRIKEYALYLKFYVEQREDVMLQVFNQKGEYERDLLMRPDAEPGRYDMKYKISLYGMPGEKYYVRLFVGDEMRNEFTLVIKDT